MTVHYLHSKRGKLLPDVFQYDDIPQPFRVQVVWVWRDVFDQGDTRAAETWYEQIHNVVCREHGLSSMSSRGGGIDDIVKSYFLQVTDSAIALDIIEASCLAIEGYCIEDIGYSRWNERDEVRDNAIEEVNHRFREHGLGYEYVADVHQLIRVDNTVIHESTVKPALGLLTDPRFAVANTEYLEAWDDYKKSDFDDCLVKCGSAFESFMKVVCTDKGWAFASNATAQPLLQTILPNTALEPFFEQPLMLIATIRNRLSRAHGGGTTARAVPIHVAHYALSATAAAMLLLANEVR